MSSYNNDHGFSFFNAIHVFTGVVFIQVVPVSLGYAQGPNVSARTVAELDTFCAANAVEFLKFGKYNIDRPSLIIIDTISNRRYLLPAAIISEILLGFFLRLIITGLEDPRVVGQFPFYWAGGVRNPDGSVTGNVGIDDLPKCAATYKVGMNLLLLK